MTNLTWKYVGHEAWREYRYRGQNKGRTVRVTSPKNIAVLKNGQHRIICRNGTVRYIQPGYLAVRIQLREGKEPFGGPNS